MTGTSRKFTSTILHSIGFAIFLSSNVACANAITPAMQQKVDAYKIKAQAMATDPAVIQATREANTKGAIPGMDNAKWATTPESDATVAEMINNAAAKRLTQWMSEDANGLNKLVLTGKFGQRFAFTSKPASYMSNEKTHFSESSAGKIWQMAETQPDPSTNVETVQITVPIKDGEATVGVLLLSLTASNLAK